MLFFPYKLDIALFRVPLLTILVSLACIATFFSQVRSSGAYSRNVAAFCSSSLDVNLRAMLQAIDDAQFGSGCESIFGGLRDVREREPRIAELAAEVRGLDFYRDRAEDLRYKQSALAAGLADFETFVPEDLTDRIAYRPDRYDVVTMLTSTFAHGSIGHLLGNLLFFAIFASFVECALGALQFALAFMLMVIVTGLAYSHSVAATVALPTIGLSGVAMGMMVLLTTLLPHARVWCFFWFFFFFRRFRLPVLVIAAWHVGWNVWDVNHPDPGSNVNYVAHVSGAVVGLVLGLFYRVFASSRLSELAASAD